MKSFVDKYKPKNSGEIPQNLEDLKRIIKNKQHALIVGPTGSCKTSAIYTIADELNYETIEINASDFRTKDQIESIIGSASKQQSLFMKEKIIIVDEVDCLSGTEDRGGAVAIVAVLKESKFPIILTANDINNDKIKDIKKIVKTIEFKPVISREIIKIMKNICEKENIKYSEENLRELIINSNGDLRAALNDLQGNIINNELIVTKPERDYELGIINILNKVFKTKSFEVHKVLENSNINLDEYTAWLDENIVLEYKNENDLLKAYELMSKADIFKGRIHKWQQWRLMYYQSLLLSMGISNAKSTINNSFTNYKRPMRFLRIWQLKMKNMKKKSIAEKIAKKTHTSLKDVTRNFHFYHRLLKNKDVLEELKLNQEEVEYVRLLV